MNLTERSYDLARAMLRERHRQIEKFGTQRDVPSLPPEDFRATLLICSETAAKQACDSAFREGIPSFAHVAIEELAEAIDAPDEEARRVELVQLATVCMGWIEAIDARAQKRPPTELVRREGEPG